MLTPEVPESGVLGHFCNTDAMGRRPDEFSLFERMYLWQERSAEQWGNPLSSALDRLSRRHLILGPVVQALTLFAASFVVFWAFTGFNHTVFVGFIIICGIGAILLLIWNLGYYRWLRTKSQAVGGTQSP